MLSYWYWDIEHKYRERWIFVHMCSLSINRLGVLFCSRPVVVGIFSHLSDPDQYLFSILSKNLHKNLTLISYLWLTCAHLSLFMGRLYEHTTTITFNPSPSPDVLSNPWHSSPPEVFIFYAPFSLISPLTMNWSWKHEPRELPPMRKVKLVRAETIICQLFVSSKTKGDAGV